MADETEKQLSLCEKGARALQDSKNLKKVLEYALAFGNYLNGGTAKGGAYGFKIDTINKLKGTKSADNKLNLQHFLIRTVHEKAKYATHFVDDLADLPPSSRGTTIPYPSRPPPLLPLCF